MDLKSLFKDKLMKDIVKFFHENQTCIDTPRGIATWVKAERSAVKKALDKLAELGILTAHRVSSTTGYSYTRDAKLIKEIGKELPCKES
jgi:predicted transcriptional regulator